MSNLCMMQSVNPILNAQVVDGVYLKEIDLTHSVDNLIEHKQLCMENIV